MIASGMILYVDSPHYKGLGISVEMRHNFYHGGGETYVRYAAESEDGHTSGWHPDRQLTPKQAEGAGK